MLLKNSIVPDLPSDTANAAKGKPVYWKSRKHKGISHEKGRQGIDKEGLPRADRPELLVT